MRPLLIETVTGQTMADLRSARDRSREADLVELRLDGVGDLDVPGALAGRRHRVVVTCRPTWEGGRFDGPEETRQAILRQALEAGAEFVDVEWKAGFDGLVAEYRDRIVLSSHDFSGVPSDLASRARAMRGTGAALIKLAVMPRALSDLLPLRQIAADGPAVVIGMGDTGLPSRLLAAHFGSRWSYSGQSVAPGQVPPARMVREFRFRETTADTRVYGVVGNNVGHSLSPVMHNAAFAAAGIDAVYVPLLPADFGDFLVFADALRIEGVSVTVPYKIDALHAAVQADALSKQVGAANTLRRAAAGFDAANTDVAGFLAPLDARYPGGLHGLRVAVLGAGGSARAVVAGLRTRGATITVHARRPEQAQELASAFGVDAGGWPVGAGTWDLLVNTTPAGSATARDASPLPGGPFTGELVYDLTYRMPGEEPAPLLREAQAAGCAVVDGLPMLVAQAEQQFAWWTGRAPAEGLMAAAVAQRLTAQA